MTMVTNCWGCPSEICRLNVAEVVRVPTSLRGVSGETVGGLLGGGAIPGSEVREDQTYIATAACHFESPSLYCL